MDPWVRREIERLAAEYGTVPPPWVVFHENPLSICWRWGGGESHLMVWWAWWPRQQFTEEQKVAYFRRWPPPHCWLAFLIEAVWGADASDEDALGPYFDRAAALGFGGREDYQRDLEDPRWLER